MHYLIDIILPLIEETLAVIFTNKLECFLSDWLPSMPEPFNNKGEKYLAIKRGPIVFVSNVLLSPCKNIL